MTGPETIELILAGHGVKLEREYRFNSARKWRADFVIHEHNILIEFEGGIYGAGRHGRGRGYSNDCKKYNSATCLGYRVLRYTIDMIQEHPGQVLDDVLCIIKGVNQ